MAMSAAVQNGMIFDDGTTTVELIGQWMSGLWPGGPADSRAPESAA